MKPPLASLAVLFLAAPLTHVALAGIPGQDDAVITSVASDPAPCDDSAIDWILPGQFAAAQARAARENQILLIKGVSFGIDTAGAKCATEGTW